jgi:hypothetical protein
VYILAHRDYHQPATVLEGVKVLSLEEAVDTPVAQVRELSTELAKQLTPLHRCKIGHLLKHSEPRTVVLEIC